VTERLSVSVPEAADRVAGRLRAALVGAGFNVDRDFEAVRAEVTATGQGYVTLGKLLPAAAERLCELLESCDDIVRDADRSQIASESSD
jgi:hypothetical protein